MIFNMHCRPSSSTNDDYSYSSFLFAHSENTNTLKHGICSLSSYNDQIPPVPQRRRRRLEDPVVTYASNYYVTDPCQTSHSPSSSPPLSSSRQIHQKLDDKHIYCDLFNLLERPTSIKQKKKYISNDSKSSSSCIHRSIVYKNSHANVKDLNERKRHQQQSSCVKENLSSIQNYDRLEEKEKNHKSIYRRSLLSKGFFRRVIRNYFVCQ